MPIDDPRKLFAHKLGTALSSEKKILTMLKKLEREVTRDELRSQFAHHREETEGQIRNIEQAFETLGERATGHRNPTIEGLAEQADTMLGKVDEALVDAVALGGAAETEHLEIAMYRSLITQAEALGEDDIVALLQENLEQEEHTRDEVERAAQFVAQRTRTTV